MLTPDVETTQNDLNANASAASAVSQYAQATISAVPKLKNPPDWFAPIQSHLTTAQGHATNWLKNICPAVTVGVPQGIISYNDSFQSTSNQILAIMEDAQNASGQPSDQQRADIDALFGDLNTAIGEQQTTLESLQQDIKTYSTDIKNDRDNLAIDLGTVSAKFVDGQLWVQQLTATISDNFLTSNVLGPCIAIVEIDMNVSFKVQGIGSDPSLITLVFAKAILENQTGNSQAAQQAVQSVLDTWTTLLVKNQAVINDLNDAQDAQYINILAQVDLITAQTQWQQLADFARGLNA